MDDAPKGKLLRDYTPAASPPSGFNVPKAASSDQSGVRDRRHPSVGEVRGSGESMRPLGVGGGGGVCANFALSDNGTDITVSIGQAGSQIVAETTVAYGASIYLQVTLDPTDGSYTAAIVTSNATESDTVKHILLGSSNGDGSVVVQNECGSFVVTACRDWYASPANYSFSVT